MTEAAADPVRARAGRVLAAIALALGLAMLMLALGLYAARRQIARDAVTGWLRSKGIASESSFQELGPGRLVGRLRVGPADAPDLTVERAEVDYSLAGLIAGQGVQVTSIRLLGPVLKARFRRGRFSAGALDPLIDEFRKRPPRPGAPSPRIEIEHGRLVLDTDYGLLRANADALIENARLVRLAVVTQPMHVAAAGLQADLGSATLEAQARGDRLTASLGARLVHAKLKQGAALQDGTLTLALDAAYPDLSRAAITSGTARAALGAATIQAMGASGKSLRLQARSGWRWTRAAAAPLTGDLSLSATAGDVAAAELRLATLAADLTGGYSTGAQPSVRLTGSADARGGWGGLGPPAKGDSLQIVALKRALRAFRASVQGLQMALDRSGAQARLAGPARLIPDAGGELRLMPRGAGYRLTAAGGGLPALAADIHAVSVSRGGVAATGAVKAALSIGPLQDGVYDAAGELRIAGGEASFLASRCAELTAARLDLGANSVERPSAAFCPTNRPLLSVGRGGWSLAARAERAAGAVPSLKARLSDGAGLVRLADQGGRLSASLKVSGARVRDAAKAERFRPLAISGAVKLARDLWTGDLDVRLPKGAPVAHAALRQDARSGEGEVRIETGALDFRSGGLQPTDITPLAQSLGSAVQGRAEFSGGFHWTPSGGTSRGELKLAQVDFKSAIGAVTNLSGDIRFTSLDPLTAPVGQMVRAERIAAALPLSDVSASLALDGETLRVARARGSAGGGALIVSDLDVPLAAGEPIRGALLFEGVQLHDLVEASPFGDRVDLDARVSGRIPFEAQGGKVRISGGDLHAVAPGRLSIQRAALTALTAQGSAQASSAAAPPVAGADTFSDFAYQALENLAFRSLEARVDTRPDGRLGVLFHIVGYHDPPTHQEITLSWWDLVRRRFLGRKLPLPSGTGVDLTLDTTLNLDDLLSDYAEFERLKGSGQVQR
ncbi:MAG TPA: YdbH domain-containing protein [Phenylobacterium sp.]|uniref:intermembrane phospholipid transport protein YdbH family protein n=1 Tax=Phenylobacterium sp. TaxID=1871053 RepID=UPI002D12E118|nr:YdbH domain-containing protein [Phenylobacterium sp.]HSV03752.1 YdbH domain-containing protein [Phenylobacterium sp.]